MEKKRGRPKGGVNNPEQIRSELYRKMYKLEMGQSFIIETTLEEAHKIRSRVTIKERKPEILRGRRFSSALYTAVNAVNPAKIMYIIKIKREE